MSQPVRFRMTLGRPPKGSDKIPLLRGLSRSRKSRARWAVGDDRCRPVRQPSAPAGVVIQQVTSAVNRSRSPVSSLTQQRDLVLDLRHYALLS